MHDGWLKVAVGTGRRRSMNERDRAIIAAHEVGHAICGKVHGDTRRVEEISLFAHGEALGVTVSSQEDNDLPAESDLRARLVALMGGRAAEELLFHEVTPGAANDFEKATQIATSMVNRWGMGHDPKAPMRGPGASGRGTLSFIAAKRDGIAAVRAPGRRHARDRGDPRRGVCGCAPDADRQHRRSCAAPACTWSSRSASTATRSTRCTTARSTCRTPTSEWRPAAARPREWAAIRAMATSGEAGTAGEATESASN